MSDFSKRFDIIYKNFVARASGGEATSKLAFSRFLNISQGRMQSWEKGQVPRPDDLEIINEKLGFDIGWMVSGKGEPFGTGSSARERELEAEVERLKSELAEADRVNRQLSARLLIDGVGDKNAATGIDKAADGQG